MSGQERSRLEQWGEASALALATALICALPTAFRAKGSAGDGLLIGAAVLLLVLLPVGLLLPKAARGFRGVVGASPPEQNARGPLWIGVAMWIGVTGSLLLVLAALLKATTNHRGLGGATFGVFGVVGLLAAAVLAGRLVAIGQALLERGWPKRVLIAVAGLITVAPLLMLLQVFVSGGEGAGTRAALLDLLLSVVVAMLVFRQKLPASVSKIQIAALPVAVLVIAAGMWRVETAPESADAVTRGGGLPASVLVALEAWSDHDGDGRGAYFGGRDCDEGDPARNAHAAEERAGDGRDSNCDGLDDPITARKDPAPKTMASATKPAAMPPKLDKPDLILVTLDTVRADRTSVYGYERDTTPNLKKLAERAVVFEHGYAAGADTRRALMPLVSGKALSRTPRTSKEWPRLREEVNTVAERLSAAGYATAAVTSFTWLRKDRGFGQGFGVFDESPWSERHPEREATGELAVKAATTAYAKLAGGGKPLFLWLHMFDAHSKYLAHAAHDFGASKSDRYDAEIAHVDRHLASFMDKVIDGPRADKTVWLITGSHGEAFGEHGQSGHGRQLYDEAVRVPFIIGAPTVEPRRDDRPVSVMDIAPTLLDYAAASRDDVEGVSLRPALSSAKAAADFARDPVLTFAPRRAALIEWPLKLLIFRRDKRDDRLLLFDLAADPGETRDISAERGDDLVRLDALRRKLEK